PPRSTLVPYTTLFRSRKRRRRGFAGPSPQPLSRGERGFKASAALWRREFHLRRAHRIARIGAAGQLVRRAIPLHRLQVAPDVARSEEHTSELQSRENL